MRRISRGVVPGLAVLAVLGSGGWLATAASQNDGGFAGTMHGTSMWGRGMTGGGMMGGWSWSPGEAGPVQDMAEARTRAESAAAQLGSGLSVGEVMEFEENYYAELENGEGDLATELLIDPATGAVQVEYGPAMMWNQDYGMMRNARTQTSVSAAEARERAGKWAQDRGVEVGEADAFPGYYTLHTLRDGQVDGMVSVNASTGDIWYHDWHGSFLDMSESG